MYQIYGVMKIAKLQFLMPVQKNKQNVNKKNQNKFSIKHLQSNFFDSWLKKFVYKGPLIFIVIFFIVVQNKNFMSQEIAGYLKDFNLWIEGFGMSSKTGFLFTESENISTALHHLIFETFSSFNAKVKNGLVAKTVEQMDEAEIDISDADSSHAKFMEIMCARDLLSTLVNSYINQKMKEGIKVEDITIPKKITIPLMKYANFLKMKSGIAPIFNCVWKLNNPEIPLEQREDLYFEDFKLRDSFSPIESQERAFFGLSVVGSFYIFRSLREIYIVGKLINDYPEKVELILSRMKRVVKNIQKLAQALLRIHSLIQIPYFHQEVRPFLGGWKVRFEGFDEVNVSSGGSGGSDPMYGLFESAMGIQFSNDLIRALDVLQGGISQKHKDLRLNIEKSGIFSIIREYFSLSPALAESYNEVLQAYSNFYRVHNTIIRNFVLSSMGKSEGTANSPLHIIMTKADQIRENKINLPKV